MPTGRLIKKIQCQLKLSVIQPPSVGPIAGAATTAMPYKAKACPRCSVREGIGQDRLFARRQTASAQALQDARENQDRQRGRQPAEQRADGEQRYARHVEALAAETVREPAGDGQHDRAGHEIAGQNPGCLFLARAQGSGNVGQRNIGDRGVQHLHECRQRHRQCDQPRIMFRMPALDRREVYPFWRC